MGDVVRKKTRGQRADSTELGGPGATPSKPAPEELFVPCPKCKAVHGLPPHPMALKLWSQLEKGEGEAEIAKARKKAYDALEPRGWDARCPRCGAEFRVVYTLEEWGKMSGLFSPLVFEVLYLK